MRFSGWKRVGLVLVGLWYLFWVAAYFIARSGRDEAISVDEGVSGEKWTAATINPLVIQHQVAMNQAMIAIMAPIVIVALVYVVRWVRAGFRDK